MPKKFKYKTILLEDLLKIGKKFSDDPFNWLEDGLFDFGQQGWELCSISGTEENTLYYFKREDK